MSYASYTYDNKKGNLSLYWKDDSNKPIGSLGNLKSYLESKNQTLLFAMNGGMYQADQSPLGLYIENGKIIKPLNISTGSGNFYMQPNGVFYLTNDNKPGVCKTSDFKNANIKYATQSGPMLIVDGEINTKFSANSKNLNIRKGVGILPDGKAVFIISKYEVSLYNFAEYFNNMGCKNALYLDGYVSRAYIPSRNLLQTDGNFGVLVGITAK
jgi:uncharacterized protein YigE (DUF2233 family)